MLARLACASSLLFAVAPALADDTVADERAAEATTEQHAEVAIGVNPPLRWKDGDAVGISAYAGITKHHAIRGNFATYDYTDGGGTLIGDLFFGGDGSDAYMSGRITDVGLSWMYFPRKLWSGPTFEAGLLRRSKDTRVEDEYASPEIVETQSATYAGRALVGWSWLFGGHVFVSVQAGVSSGYETGRETTAPRAYMPMDMRTTTDVSRMTWAGEGFIRLGGAFTM